MLNFKTSSSFFAMLQLSDLSNLDLICLVKDLTKIKILFEIFIKTGPSTVFLPDDLYTIQKNTY